MGHLRRKFPVSVPLGSGHHGGRAWRPRAGGPSVLTDLRRHRALIGAFASRDLSTRYRSSALGWLWSLLQPLAQLVVFSVVFSTVFRIVPPPLGNGKTDVGGMGYAAFLFSGMVIWNLFAGLLNVSMMQLKDNGSLLKKVNFPAWAPVLGASIIQLIQSGLEVLVLLVLLAILGNIAWTWLLAIPILLATALFAQGVGLVLSVQNAKYGDVAHIVTVGLGALYFLTPVLYPLSLAETHGPLFASIIKFNPMTWFVQAMHDAMYSLTAPSPMVMTGILVSGFLVFWAGLAFFDRSSQDLREIL